MASFGICRRTGQATSGSLSEEKSVWIDVQLGKTGTRWAAVIKDEKMGRSRRPSRRPPR